MRSPTLIRILGGYGLTVSFVVLLLNLQDRIGRAVLGMAWGVILIWCLLGGGVMLLYRDPVRAAVRRVRLPWQVAFVLFCTLLALLEEGVTVTMTNLAPLFGATPEEAFITASTNYIEVVTRHSVVAFVPMFIAWALLLTRYRFHPNTVFLLFGFVGTLAETFFGGSVQHLFEVGFWVFVYGLMVYLPAYSVPEDRRAREPPGWMVPLAVPLVYVWPVTLLAALGLGMSRRVRPPRGGGGGRERDG